MFLVSEYIPGGELLALLDRYGKLPIELVKIFTAEIAIALGEIHLFSLSILLLRIAFWQYIYFHSLHHAYLHTILTIINYKMHYLQNI